MSLNQSTSILDRINNDAEQEAVYCSNVGYKAYGVSRHTASLNCITKDGNQVGISWSLYCEARFNPSVGIEVEFTHKRIVIKGQRLLPLYHYLIGNKVTYLSEADRPTATLEIQNETCVIIQLAIVEKTI